MCIQGKLSGHFNKAGVGKNMAWRACCLDTAETSFCARMLSATTVSALNSNESHSLCACTTATPGAMPRLSTQCRPGSVRQSQPNPSNTAATHMSKRHPSSPFSRGHASFVDAVQAWYDEVSDYDYSNPTFSGSTGHFTAVSAGLCMCVYDVLNACLCMCAECLLVYVCRHFLLASL